MAPRWPGFGGDEFAVVLDDDNQSDQVLACAATLVTALPHLHTVTRGLDQDRQAVNAALTLPFHNGGTEGVKTKNETDHAPDARPRQL